MWRWALIGLTGAVMGYAYMAMAAEGDDPEARGPSAPQPVLGAPTVTPKEDRPQRPPPPAPEAGSFSLDEAVPQEGAVKLALARAPLLEPVALSYARMERNTCMKQSEPRHAYGDRVIRHEYRVWYDGEECVQTPTPSGFETELKPPFAGEWRGEIWINGEIAHTYELEVFDPKLEELAERAERAERKKKK